MRNKVWQDCDAGINKVPIVPSSPPFDYPGPDTLPMSNSEQNSTLLYTSIVADDIISGGIAVDFEWIRFFLYIYKYNNYYFYYYCIYKVFESIYD